MELVVNQASIKTEDGRQWTVCTGGIAVTYGFDETLGICVTSFQNLACTPEMEYVKKPYGILPVVPKKDGGAWTLVDVDAKEGRYGGRAVAELTMAVRLRSMLVRLFVVAFPGTSVLRQWFEVENESIARVERLEFQPFYFRLSIPQPNDIYYAEWFGGGKPVHESGGLLRKAFTMTYYEPYTLHLESEMTAEYVPLLLLTRDYGPKDGLMMALDYAGPWSADALRPDGYSAEDYLDVRFQIDGGAKLQLAPYERAFTPVVTLAAYAGHRDALMKTVFDWQYTYLWDYTNPDYYAKTRGLGRWVYSSRCLTEQFHYRTAVMNLEGNLCQESGYEIVWDDAGWSALPFYPDDAYASVFQNNYEGPDHRPSQKYFRKAGLKWLLWFAGKPSIGIMENKEAAWGSFEWRTDDIVFRSRSDEQGFKAELAAYLRRNPNRSFHTCSLGGRYAHTFDIQRYSNYNYASDAGAGYHLNHYFSYFEVPDKWGDILATFGGEQMAHDGTKIWSSRPADYSKVQYSEEFSRRRLGMVPMPALTKEENRNANRFDNRIYRYLKENGAAGRWSYAYHPTVYGDEETCYLQRMSADHKRGCIIIGHCPPRPIYLFPHGLLEDEVYEITFQNRGQTCAMPGKTLMETGLYLENVGCGELVYLNLSDHPGSTLAGLAVSPPPRAAVRQETNIGHDGVGIYWIGAPGRGVSHYQVCRAGVCIANVAVGTYWFDYSDAYDPDACYEIRTVADNGSVSTPCKAEKFPGEPFAAAASGSHGAQMSAKGWAAEHSADLKQFGPMTFVPPAQPPLADLGGTPNQTGGIEGYWEGPGGAKVARGWQQTSAEVYCIRRYTVKEAGTYTLTARANRDWYHMESGGAVRACILLNERVLMPWTVLRKNDLYGAAYFDTLHLRQGDELRFVLDKSQMPQPVHTDPEAELVSWSPVLTMQTDDRRPTRNLRISCGSAAAVTDEYGNVWQPDQYGTKGNAGTVPGVELPLLQTARRGQEIAYAFPAEDGLYALRLRFARAEAQCAGQQVMDICVNGAVVKSQFDIAEAALFTDGVCEQVFWNVLPDTDGHIHVELRAVCGEAQLQAIELAPVLPDTVRVNCGSDEPFLDWMGNLWQADPAAGETLRSDVPVVQASPTLYDQGLYQTARCGQTLEYTLPVRDSFYSVHLKFAELWLPAGQTCPMDIYINGCCVRRRWDARSAAGYKNMAADLRFDAVSPVDGAITVRICARGDYPAIIQAIELDTET